MSASLADRVAAVVVNYNAGDHLRDCVHSLRAAGVGIIIVADNASSDGSLVALQRVDPDVCVVETGGNLGYGGGVNRGAAACAAAGDVLPGFRPDPTPRSRAGSGRWGTRGSAAREKGSRSRAPGRCWTGAAPTSSAVASSPGAAAAEETDQPAAS